MDPSYEPYWSDYLKRFDLPPSAFQNIPATSTKYCVIVEPRKHPLLGPVVKNFMSLLQHKGWGLIIFHGTENEEFSKALFDGWPNVHYRNLQVANLTIQMYNRLFTTAPFWESIKALGGEHALIFQTDTILRKDTVDEFLEYDYVGAPWAQPDLRWFGCLEVGNGGLSLRRVDAMLEIVTRYPSHGGNEDGYFSLVCLKRGYKVPSISVAQKFAVETIFYEDPCGLHKPHLGRLPSDAIKRLLGS